MAAELVVAMEGYMESDFDAMRTVGDFMVAMQIGDAFREEVEDVHSHVTAVAWPLKPDFVRLINRCAKILEPRGRA